MVRYILIELIHLVSYNDVNNKVPSKVINNTNNNKIL